jgi:hypothetical protein
MVSNLRRKSRIKEKSNSFDTVSGEVYEKQWLSSWQMDEDLP